MSADERQTETGRGSHLDLARVVTLARAVHALMDGGLVEQARPLSAELLALLEAAQDTGAPVVSLAAERARRGDR